MEYRNENKNSPEFDSSRCIGGNGVRPFFDFQGFRSIALWIWIQDHVQIAKRLWFQAQPLHKECSDHNVDCHANDKPDLVGTSVSQNRN